MLKRQKWKSRGQSSAFLLIRITPFCVGQKRASLRFSARDSVHYMVRRELVPYHLSTSLNWNELEIGNQDAKPPQSGTLVYEFCRWSTPIVASSVMVMSRTEISFLYRSSIIESRGIRNSFQLYTFFTVMQRTDVNQIAAIVGWCFLVGVLFWRLSSAQFLSR
jgi:hypothetical protein